MGDGTVRQPVWQATASDGAQTAAVAAGAGTTILNAGGANGRLCKVVITSAGTTGNLTFYDSTTGATGTVLAVIPGATNVATAVIGTVYTFSFPYQLGLAAVGAAGSPGVSVSFV